MKEQCDQGLHCLPFRLHRLDEGVVWSGSPLSFRLHRLDEGVVWSGSPPSFRLHRLDEGAVWSGSTLFALPFASFGWMSSLIRVYTVYHSICTIRMKEQSDQGLHCLPFHLHHLNEEAVRVYTVIQFVSFGWRSSLIRIYSVCHFVCIVWMKEHSVCIVWIK